MTEREPSPGSLTVYNFVKGSLACEIYLTIQYRGSDDTDEYALGTGYKKLRPPWNHVHFIHGLGDSRYALAGTTNVIVWEYE